MPEYVYALYDFLPEHEDEASFHSGERIEVIEKDDLYVDGWWHVCVLALHLFRRLMTVLTGPYSCWRCWCISCQLHSTSTPNYKNISRSTLTWTRF